MAPKKNKPRSNTDVTAQQTKVKEEIVKGGVDLKHVDEPQDSAMQHAKVNLELIKGADLKHVEEPQDSSQRAKAQGQAKKGKKGADSKQAEGSKDTAAQQAKINMEVKKGIDLKHVDEPQDSSLNRARFSLEVKKGAELKHVDGPTDIVLDKAKIHLEVTKTPSLNHVNEPQSISLAHARVHLELKRGVQLQHYTPIEISTSAVQVQNPKGINFIFGQSHFIKTVEDIYEALATAAPNIKFGIAFNEASGPRLVRWEGNDEQLIHLAIQNAQSVGAGHSFFIFLENAFPINVLKAVEAVPEVVRIYCATANPTQVLVAETDQGRGVIGVIDGGTPQGIETEKDKEQRRDFLRQIGYKRY